VTETLPSDLDTERLVLGCLLHSEDLLHDARGVLDGSDFTNGQNRTIWEAICKRYDQGAGVDRVTVISELKDSGRLDSAGGIGYVIDLDNGTPTLPHVEDYIRRLQDKTAIRRVLVATRTLEQRCYSGEPAQAILDSASDLLLDLVPQQNGRGFASIASVVSERGVNALLSPRRESGIKLPWPGLNQWTAGLHPEQMIVLAAHTNCGKTSAALQIATTAARAGHWVAIFSLEMSTDSLVRRMVAQESRVPSDYPKNLTFSERSAMVEAVTELNQLPIYFDDSTASTVPAIHAALRKLRIQHSIGLVIVDYLQCVRDSNRRESRNAEVGANSRALKLAAKEFGCPFLVLSQVSRKSTHEDREPELSDLRDSGEIEENADAVLFIHPLKADAQDVRPAKLLIAKQREGARDVCLKMLFFPKIQRFEEEETCPAS
jgi:replicative DNA helicase